MEVERVKGLRLKTTLARRKLYSRKNLSDACDQRGLENLTPRSVARDLTNRTLRVDYPLDDEIAFDPRVGAQRLLVASAGFIAMGNDYRADVSRTATRVVTVRPDPTSVNLGRNGR